MPGLGCGLGGDPIGGLIGGPIGGRGGLTGGRGGLPPGNPGLPKNSLNIKIRIKSFKLVFLRICLSSDFTSLSRFSNISLSSIAK